MLSDSSAAWVCWIASPLVIFENTFEVVHQTVLVLRQRLQILRRAVVLIALERMALTPGIGSSIR